MERVFVVFQVVPYEGEYIRGIYVQRENAELRVEGLVDEAHLWGDWDSDESWEIRETEVGVPLEVS